MWMTYSLLFANSSHDDEHSIYSQFFGALSDEWDVEDEGEVEDLLSIEIHTEDGCVVMRQRAYIEKLLATFAPDGKPTSTFSGSRTLASQSPGQVPADPTLNKLVDDAMLQDVGLINATLLKDYQSLIGSLTVLRSEHATRCCIRCRHAVSRHGPAYSRAV